MNDEIETRNPFDDAIELLDKAKALITDPHAWAQGASAYLPDGQVTSGCDPKAVCFCALGALDRAGGEVEAGGSYTYAFHVKSYADRALYNVAAARGFINFPRLNDSTDHATVLAAFDEAKDDVRRMKAEWEESHA